MERSISVTIGQGCLNHNNRVFVAENVDSDRISRNVVFVRKDIRVVYHELFDEAVAEYNDRQKRKDRRISDYYKKIKNGSQEHLFTEVIVQIGNMKDSNCTMEEAETVQGILTDYMQDFEKRNPNLKVFNAVLHMDEQTPHLHIDFVPFSEGNKRGLSTKVSLKGAMKAQGFTGTGRNDTESMHWVQVEKEYLAELMRSRGLEWKQLGTHEKHLSVYNYEKKMRKQEVEELERQLQAKADTLAQQEKLLVSNRKTLQVQQEQKDELMQSCEEWKEKKQEVKERYFHYLSFYDRMEQAHVGVKKEYENLQQEYDDLRDDYDGLHRELCNARKEHEELWESRESLRRDCEELKENHKTLHGDCEALCDERDSLERDCKALEQNHKKLELQKVDLQKALSGLQTDKESAEQALADAKDELGKAQIETEIVRAQRDRVVADTEKTRLRLERYVEHAEELYQKYSSVAVTSRQAELFEEVLKAQNEKEELRYENEKLWEENRTLRLILDKAEEFMCKLVVSGQNLWDAFTEKLAVILPGRQRKEENEYRR